MVYIHREIFHGRQWLEDPRFYAPMADSACGHVYVHDFVIFQEHRLGRVNRFYCSN